MFSPTPFLDNSPAAVSGTESSAQARGNTTIRVCCALWGTMSEEEAKSATLTPAEWIAVLQAVEKATHDAGLREAPKLLEAMTAPSG